MRRAIPLLLFAVSACQDRGKEPDEFVTKSENAVRKTLRDPESATFQIISSSAAENIACGQVNAKNGFGGYTGLQYFVVENGTVHHSGDANFSAAFKRCTDIGIAEANARTAVLQKRQ